MDINTAKAPVIISNYSSMTSSISQADGVNSIPIDLVKPETVKDQLQSIKHVTELNSDDISQITDGLNKFMKTINADLHFAIHDKTQRVMVQVVDTKDKRVIKEFPAHELLDTLAVISDYVGILLDKKV